jgi:hypothetical protein
MCPACWMTELTVILGAASSGTLGLLIVNWLRDRFMRGEQANSIAEGRNDGYQPN